MKIISRFSSTLKFVVPVASFAISAVCALAQPTITQQPTNQSVLLGASANFSVAASGTSALFYVWQLDGTNTSNSDPSLSIPVVHHADVGSYDVIVSNQTGSVTSAVVQLTLAGPPPIITLMTNTPLFNVISVQYSVAPNGSFQLLETHDLTPPVQWYGPDYIGQSGGATNDNWSYDYATNYTEFYPESYWQLDPYP
jgi:hypothetical protein